MSDNWLSKEDNRNKRGYGRNASKKERGRENALKDLFGTDRARMEIEAKQRPAEHIGDVVMDAVKGFKVSKNIGFSVLLDEWEETVGNAVSSLSTPSAINGSELMIEVTHASAIFVFENQMKKEILEKIQQKTPQVKSIRFIPAGRKI